MYKLLVTLPLIYMPVIAHLNHHLGFFTKADYAKLWELYMDIDALVCRDIDEMFCAFM